MLAPLTPDPLDFPYMSMREFTVGDVPVRALRVTFVGELGWELYCPTEYGAGLWRALWEAGRAARPRAGGYRAIDSLRLEKGYRVWAADITPDETPYEAGSASACATTRSSSAPRRCAASAPRRAALPRARGPALGRARQRARPRRRRGLRSGHERRLRLHGRALDRLRLPARRDTVGTAVEVDIFGRWVAGEVSPPSRCSTPTAPRPRDVAVTTRGAVGGRSLRLPRLHVRHRRRARSRSTPSRPRSAAASGCSAALPSTSRSRPRSSTPSRRRPGRRRLRGGGVRGAARAGVDTSDIEHVAGGRTFFWRGDYGWDLNDARDARHPAQRVRRLPAQALGGLALRRRPVPGQHPARPPAPGSRAVRARRGSSRSTR